MFNYAPEIDEGGTVDAEPAAFYNMPYSTGQGSLTPVGYLVGLIALLVIMHFIGRSSKTSIQPAHLEISGYNVLGVTSTAIVGIVTAKLILNKWQVVGLTDLVNAV